MDLLKLAASGDNVALEKLVEQNYGLVLSIVKRFSNRGVDREDLIQIGSIGLIKAIKNFNTDYDVMFSTYAVPMIAGEIKRFLRDDGPVKVSRSLKELYMKARAASVALSIKLGREPGLSEVAESLNVSVEDLTLAMEAQESPESFYSMCEGEEVYLLDKLSAEKESEFEGILDRMTVVSLLKCLDSEERNIITLRYLKNKTQSDVGRVMGISQVQVSRREKRALKKMREHAD
ncbi:MAG: SigB/SigF/SigG family RNA polymerase sigma factor [Ruminococcaceae bacterium]|nr:SigB/SigF/SigG family RNA polymerase sigma factor [Oscillospiraceae bacterium]